MMTVPNNRKVLGIILTKENLKKLPDGVIHFNAEEMGLIDFKCNEILIAYYETEKQAKEALESGGLITKQTKIIEDKKIF